MSRLSPDDLLARMPFSPDIYLQKIDFSRQAVLAIQFAEAAYRSASFLDDRVLMPGTQGGWIDIMRIQEAARAIPRVLPLHFIFHTGHVGSTLVSRLLDETGHVLSLREPLSLRNLADAADSLGQADSLLSEAQFNDLLRAVLRLWGRGYDGTRHVVIKATSSAARFAPALLAVDRARRAVCMNLRVEPYLATLLAGQNSPIDLRGHGPGRIRRLQRHLGSDVTPLHAMSLGELAAMSWLVETWTQRGILEQFGAAVLVLDFDEFLGDVSSGMRRVVTHLGIDDMEAYLRQVSASPVLRRYSKASDQPYSPRVRAEALQDSRQRNAAQIRAGMNWLDDLARTSAKVSEILESA